ncbi:MAG: hypothetical protein HOJ22_02085 [Chloroflexi bacterium]|jgi:hypothetical protein|nr:hypothetical protein [Chloroflexota bacterium]MBT5627054.1 hypothetical protein [Chloroflexota bacterium]
MTPWIFIVLGLIVVVGIAKLALMWKFAQAQPAAASGDGVVPMSNRRAWEFAIGLIALVFLTFGYGEMNLWFLPIVAYVAVWTPQVARKAATPRQAIYVGAAFGASMVAAVLIQILV